MAEFNFRDQLYTTFLGPRGPLGVLSYSDEDDKDTRNVMKECNAYTVQCTQAQIIFILADMLFGSLYPLYT